MAATVKKGEYTYGNPEVWGDGIVIIGKFSSIAADVKFVTSGHRTDLFTTYPLGHTVEAPDLPREGRLGVNGKITIGNDVWIGTDSTILQGAIIGDGCIIGAGSVVRGKMKAYSLSCGNPCQFLHYRFDKKTIELLLKLKWWNLPYNLIKENYETLTSNSYDKLLEMYNKINK